MKLVVAAAFLSFLAVPAFAEAHIERGSKIFIEPMPEGFNAYLQAAFVKKHVPVVMVGDEVTADYVIAGTAETNKAGWAKTIFVTPKGDADASITVKEAKTGNVVYGYAVDKFGARHGQQSTAEACAKHLKAFIEKN
jgi:predicted HAD superfamily phosphohydrolase YqeG